ncbi:hypothetical protein [Clostridium perfringens]|uniref:hypothetical protein n=1 Tax=Clostridium perfringens TaxID=1502 RepID=UPI00096A9466|nr:hypothetical protein [Clostridium perfringens]
MGCNIPAILLKYNAYFNILNLNLDTSFSLINSVIEQFLNDRTYITYALENTFNSFLGGEYKTFKDYLKDLLKIKDNNVIERKKKANKIKKKQKDLLKKLL